MNATDKAYNDQINFLESFFEFHPGFFVDFTPAEKMDLSTYFFVGREIDVDNIFEYRRTRLAADPGLQDRAEAVLLKLWKIAHIDGDPPLAR